MRNAASDQFYSLQLLGFIKEIFVTYVAAMLMVVGYSINDAVEVFDRLRENMKERKPKTPEDLRTLVNDSLSHMSFRTLFFLSASQPSLRIRQDDTGCATAQ